MMYNMVTHSVQLLGWQYNMYNAHTCMPSGHMSYMHAICLQQLHISCHTCMPTGHMSQTCIHHYFTYMHMPQKHTNMNTHATNMHMHSTWWTYILFLVDQFLLDLLRLLLLNANMTCDLTVNGLHLLLQQANLDIALTQLLGLSKLQR